MNWEKIFNLLFDIINTPGDTYYSGPMFLNCVREVNQSVATYDTYINQRREQNKSTSRRDYYYELLMEQPENDRRQIVTAILDMIGDSQPEKSEAIRNILGQKAQVHAVHTNIATKILNADGLIEYAEPAKTPENLKQLEYDVALSFAGEDREYVEKVANFLRNEGIKVFYDKFEEIELWGKNLYQHLSDIYSKKARYTIMFISEHYAKKNWPNHERISMQSRAFQENEEYILPARFDETEIPGLLSTIAYIPLKEMRPEDFAKKIIAKLGGYSVTNEIIHENSSSIINIPKIINVPKNRPTLFSVSVKNEGGHQIIDAKILLVADNGTFLRPSNEGFGVYNFEIKTNRSYKLFFANNNYPALIIEKIDPANDIEISISLSENVGSMICDNGTGYISGLKGRLNPILDHLNRTYLYAENISINDGQRQPVTFKLNEPMELEDCDGIIMQVRVRDIQGSCSLIEYVKPKIE